MCADSRAFAFTRKSDELALPNGYHKDSESGSRGIRSDFTAVGDNGFRVFKLDSSNVKTWEPDPHDLEQSLLDHVDHIKSGRSEQDILYELLLKRGLDLCDPMASREIAGKSVYAFGGGELIACLAQRIEKGEVEGLAGGVADWHDVLDNTDDTTVVFRDSAFDDDVAKTNCTEILRQRGVKQVRSI